MRWCADSSAADWLASRLDRTSAAVVSLVPAGFAGYALIPNDDPLDGARNLTAGKLRELERILQPWTGNQGCLFAFWDGFGWLHGSSATAPMPVAGSGSPAPPWLPGGLTFPVPDSARVSVYSRTYLVYEGVLSDCAALLPLDQTPNLWWPRDRSWLVATDIDLDVTYVAGEQALIGELRVSAELRAVDVTPNDPLPGLPSSPPDSRRWPRRVWSWRVPRR